MIRPPHHRDAVLRALQAACSGARRVDEQYWLPFPPAWPLRSERLSDCSRTFALHQTTNAAASPPLQEKIIGATEGTGGVGEGVVRISAAPPLSYDCAALEFQSVFAARILFARPNRPAGRYAGQTSPRRAPFSADPRGRAGRVATRPGPPLVRGARSVEVPGFRAHSGNLAR